MDIVAVTGILVNKLTASKEGSFAVMGVLESGNKLRRVLGDVLRHEVTRCAEPVCEVSSTFVGGIGKKRHNGPHDVIRNAIAILMTPSRSWKL